MEKAKKLNDSIKQATISLAANVKNTQLQLDNMQRRVDVAKKSINTVLDGSIGTKLPIKSSQVLTDIKSTLNQIYNINIAASNDFKNPVSAASLSKDLATAKSKEREGFQDLVDGNFKGAALAFQSAEDAYNGYHWVYELRDC
ncbi:hypothetical protein [Pedobacter sp. L105]|uniref:hypothetical protein n=1 Tax=Pedobacter sp. L105 TaxID=1641871 RepID=UPI00131DBD16|nr:hypothetical protein [Pedobacter sp. L105]